MTAAIIVTVVAILAIGWVIATYNKLIKLNNLKDEGWSGIDVQLKRRFDLIPNLVLTVKGYAAHESNAFENIANARASVIQAGDDSKARIDAENALSGTLRSLFAVAENYPELKANTNFLQLQEQLAHVEDELQMARRYYNGTVRNFNTSIQSFPANIIAGKLGFSKAPFFEAEQESRQTPTAQL